MELTYTMTNESITVIFKGKPHTVKRGSANFDGLRKALIAEDWDTVPQFLTVTKAIAAWSAGEFTLINGHVTYQDKPLPEALHKRMLAMVTEGAEPTTFMRFWERLSKNPEQRSREQLFGFLDKHKHISITDDGYFLAYKGVRNDFKDCHTGTIDNSPGKTNEMPRSKVSSDPSSACSYGYHVGALSYADGFGPKNVIVKVDPADVVCVPNDSSWRKIRVCKYTVVGLYGSALPSTSVKTSELEVDVKDTGGVTEGPGDNDLAKPKKKKTEKTTVSGRKSRARGASDPSMWKGFDKMAEFELLEQKLDDLRRYAAKGLHIVRASKIPGGKMGLIQAIIRARKKDN